MTYLGPTPVHLTGHNWYVPHQAWLHECGLPHHDPVGADACRANLTDANLRGAYLRQAYLEGANMTGANLRSADLQDADLTRVILLCADLSYADLQDADLSHVVLLCADLSYTDLRGANLSYADLRGADLRGVDLTHADLTDAVLPDGRTLEEWRADPLAGLCTDPEARARATAAWGQHSWRDCPLHEGMGINSLRDVEDDVKRLLAACFVTLFDSHHLPKPGDGAAT